MYSFQRANASVTSCPTLSHDNHAATQPHQHERTSPIHYPHPTPASQFELTEGELEELHAALQTEHPEQVMRRLGVMPVDMPKAWDPAENVRGDQ